MIKRIELINFMSHQHTVIEPADGLTVLIGPNNCGKSAVVNALQILCANSSSKHVLRHGTKECQIIVETNTGDRVVWTRKKSGSPKYEINGRTFDRLNRKVPDELHQVLKLPAVVADKESYDVHFGEQRNPIFLLADKEKAAAEFFASSSDASRLVEMQNLHKTKVRKCNFEVEQLKQEKDVLTSETEILLPLKEIHEQAEDCQTQYTELNQAKQIASKLERELIQLTTQTQRAVVLESLEIVLGEVPKLPDVTQTQPIQTTIERLQKLENQCEFLSQCDQMLAPLPVPPALSNTYQLSHAIGALQQSQRQMQTIEQSAVVLESISVPPELNHTENLQAIISELDSAYQSEKKIDQQNQLLEQLGEPPQLQHCDALVAIIKDYEKVSAQYLQLTQLLKKTEESLAFAQSELEDWIKANPQCPTCGGTLSIEDIQTNEGKIHSHTRQ